jgi:hypothetical protein
MDADLVNQIVSGSLIAVVSSFLTYVGWLKSKGVEDRKTAADLTERVALLERTSVGESRIREIISEETSDLRDSVAMLNKDIKALSDLINSLRIDLGVLNYIKGITNRGE